uniref:Ig-like domain-containing protein n=1 Tax=Hucho hucho TaxID=62062 RepID=A0A4W5KVD3_9TELE
INLECVYAAVGKTKVIEHDYSGLELLEQSFHLRWTHDSKIVYDNKKDTAKKYQTTKNGSLLLENLQLDNAGTYQATIYDNLGNHMKSTVTHLCVLAPVSKPRLTHTCNGTSVTLRCDVGNPVNVNVMWSRNGNTLPGQTGATLTITKATLKPEDRYACTASIKASEEKSDDVYPECNILRLMNIPGDDDVMRMVLWLMVLILAGAGGLLLILIIITLVCMCVCLCASICKFFLTTTTPVVTKVESVRSIFFTHKHQPDFTSTIRSFYHDI